MIPAAVGHVWKPTAEGLQHQVRFDDSNYDDKGRLKARCGKKVTPTLEQAACPGCMVASPATELAEAMEAHAIESFPAALDATTEHELRRSHDRSP